MNMGQPLDPAVRVSGIRAVVAYLVGIAVGTALALPILAALFGISLPVV
jgi:hypothetical protein